MNKLATLAAGVSALLFSSSALAVNALQVSAVVDLGWEYDATGLYNSQSQFLIDNAQYAPQSPDLTGLAVLTYDIFDFAVNGFDVDEVYEWCIEGEGFYDYFYDFGNNPVFRGEAGSFDFSFEASLSDLTLGLFGEDPFSILAYLSSLPASGTLFDLNIPELDLLLPTNLINYNSGIGFPSGFITLDTDIAAPGVATAGTAAMGISITAKRATVPDSGTTGLMAFAGFGLLIAIRRRFCK